MLCFQQGLGDERCSRREEGRSPVAHRVLSSLLASERDELLGWRYPLGQETAMLAGLDALCHGAHDIAVCLCRGCSCSAGARGKTKGRICPGTGFHRQRLLGQGVFRIAFPQASRCLHPPPSCISVCGLLRAQGSIQSLTPVLHSIVPTRHGEGRDADRGAVQINNQ